MPRPLPRRSAFIALLAALIIIAACNDDLQVAPPVAPTAPIITDQAGESQEQEATTAQAVSAVLAVKQEEQEEQQAAPTPTPAPAPAAAPEPAALSWSGEPLTPTWSADGQFTYRDALHHANLVRRAMRDELEWCLSDQAAELRDGVDLTLNDDRDWSDLVADAAQPADPSELAWIRAVADETVRRRGLPLRGLPLIRIIERDRFRSLSCAAVDQAPPDEDAAWWLESLIGMVDPAFTAAWRDHFWRTSWLAWYDADAREPSITIVGDRPLPVDAAWIMSHELVHAIQHQFDELVLSDSAPRSSDERWARGWVIEGDAESVRLYEGDPMLDAITDGVAWGERAIDDWNLISSRSQIRSPLRRALSYGAYTDGAGFVGAVRRETDWRAVDQHLLDPPDSTEQVLHLDKLLSDEPPLRLPGSGHGLPVWGVWTVIAEDRLGEFYLRTLLSEVAARPSLSADAAAGWGGDHLAIYRSQTDPSVALAVWQIVFDDPAEHTEGAAALREWLIAWSNQEAYEATDTPDDLEIIGWRRDDIFLRLVVRPDGAWLIASNDTATADASVHSILSRRPAQHYADAPQPPR